ncbi:MAG TPA: hypothetical protein DET40_05000 [Lentisphaeria bacterium]|nr:MAG: hypothetical protein A2X45_13575 [Lentisphaerae bacterium GWF2_50_93]HCE42884.1 hypothetical protein [Lentisphaeria bacterium]
MPDKTEAISAEKKRSYLRHGGKCPYCGSESITGESVDIEGTGASQEVSCKECGRSWRDVYRLVNVEEVV